MTDMICPEVSLTWPLIVFFGGLLVVSILIARKNGFTLGETIGALTGMRKFAGTAAIYLTMAATFAATVGIYFLILPECVPA